MPVLSDDVLTRLQQVERGQDRLGFNMARINAEIVDLRTGLTDIRDRTIELQRETTEKCSREPTRPQIDQMLVDSIQRNAQSSMSCLQGLGTRVEQAERSHKQLLSRIEQIESSKQQRSISIEALASQELQGLITRVDQAERSHRQLLMRVEEFESSEEQRFSEASALQQELTDNLQSHVDGILNELNEFKALSIKTCFEGLEARIAQAELCHDRFLIQLETGDVLNQQVKDVVKSQVESQVERIFCDLDAFKAKPQIESQVEQILAELEAIKAKPRIESQVATIISELELMKENSKELVKQIAAAEAQWQKLEAEALDKEKRIQLLEAACTVETRWQCQAEASDQALSKGNDEAITALENELSKVHTRLELIACQGNNVEQGVLAEGMQRQSSSSQPLADESKRQIEQIATEVACQACLEAINQTLDTLNQSSMTAMTASVDRLENRLEQAERSHRELLSRVEQQENHAKEAAVPHAPHFAAKPTAKKCLAGDVIAESPQEDVGASLIADNVHRASANAVPPLALFRENTGKTSGTTGGTDCDECEALLQTPSQAPSQTLSQTPATTADTPAEDLSLSVSTPPTVPKLKLYKIPAFVDEERRQNVEDAMTANEMRRAKEELMGYIKRFASICCMPLRPARPFSIKDDSARRDALSPPTSPDEPEKSTFEANDNVVPKTSSPRC